MNDFLAILAERSVGQASAIRPRLAARFEPTDLRSRASEDEAAGWADETNMSMTVQSSREPAVLPRPAAVPAPHLDISQPAPRTARETRPTPDSPARPQVRPTATGEPAPRATPIPRSLERDEDNPLPMLRPRVAPAVSLPTVIRVPALALPAAPAPAESHQAGPVKEKPAVRPALAVVRPSVQPLPAVPSFRGTEQREPPLPPSEPQAPVIHVTIGRIEVRASAPQPIQKVQPVSQPPVEKLEDYLRARKDRS